MGMSTNRREEPIMMSKTSRAAEALVSGLPFVLIATSFLHATGASAAICRDGATKSCFTECAGGIRTCDGGHWGPCECNLEEPEPAGPVRGVQIRSFDVGGDRDITATDAYANRTGLGVPKTFRVQAYAHDDTVGVLSIRVEKADRLYCSNESRDVPAPPIATNVLSPEFPSEIISTFSVAGYPHGSIYSALVPVGFPLKRACPDTHPILIKEEQDIWARVLMGNGSYLASRKATFTYHKTVTVVSYNTYKPLRQDYATAANQAVALSFLHPDIVLLQEAEPAHANALAATLGLPYVHGDPFGWNSIISRFPLTTGSSWVLPAGLLGSPCHGDASLVHNTVVIGGPCSGTGCPTWNLAVYNTHLDTKGDAPGLQWDSRYLLPCDTWANQAGQADAVVDHIGCGNPSFVLGGDMNARTYESTIAPMLSCWTNAFHALPNRQGFDEPNEHWAFPYGTDIDHIFLRGYEVLKTSLEPCPGCPDPSDHVPVATTIKRPGY
jgi:endonuclease/exonuclease/phosphatase family metal-dependent hydrolase